MKLFILMSLLATAGIAKEGFWSIRCQSEDPFYAFVSIRKDMISSPITTNFLASIVYEYSRADLICNTRQSTMPESIDCIGYWANRPQEKAELHIRTKHGWPSVISASFITSSSYANQPISLDCNYSFNTSL